MNNPVAVFYVNPFKTKLEKKKYNLDKNLYWITVCIMKTCPCDVHPLTPHFNVTSKMGFTGVYIIFLFLF